MDFITKFDAAYGPKIGLRALTFRAVLAEAARHNHKSIVETGCSRDLENWAGDGQSTVIWNDYSVFHVGRFFTVDIDQNATDIANGICAKNQLAKVTCADSITTLAKLTDPIDILYLDSFDLDQTNPHDAAMHCFMEFTACRHLLHKNSIVFVDDSPMNPSFEVHGKGMYVAQYMAKFGVRPFAYGYQVAWLMP